jgi:hypothetical protein
VPVLCPNLTRRHEHGTKAGGCIYSTENFD